MADDSFIVRDGQFVRHSGKFVNKDTGCTGCTTYVRAWDICTSSFTNYWICIDAEIDFTKTYKLISGTVGCLRFAFPSGRIFDTATTLPSGAIILAASDIEMDVSCSCPDGLERIETCFGTIPETCTLSFYDQFTIDTTSDEDNRFDYPFPIAGANETFIFLHTSGLFRWTTPDGDDIYTDYLADDTSGSIQAGATVEIQDTLEIAEAWFFGCNMFSYSASTQPTDGAHWYPKPSLYYDPDTWTKGGSGTWTVFKMTCV